MFKAGQNISDDCHLNDSAIEFREIFYKKNSEQIIFKEGNQLYDFEKISKSTHPFSLNFSSKVNVMTIDCEDWYHGLEIGINNWGQYERRIEKSVEKLLALFKNTSAKATFFILGHLAEEFPELVKKISDEGHEIGSHGYSHQFVYKLHPEEFRDEILRTNEILFRITGQPVLSFRAPYFSITRQSLWAFDILYDCGIVNDSSIIPVINYRYGIPEAFRMPHWVITPKGARIFEFPVSTIKAVGKNIPVAGGAYFRILPYSLVRMGLKHLNLMKCPGMVYLHPWELDDEQPHIDLPLRIRLTHYWNLKNTERKFTHLLNDFKFASFSEVIKYGGWNIDSN